MKVYFTKCVFNELSFKVDEISSSEKYEGEVSGGEIEPERHQYHLNSLSLAIPEIITGMQCNIPFLFTAKYTAL